MPLSAGTKIGPYLIVAPLGAGGMGEVYRATDTSLGRQVALKVLPSAFANNVERMARFKREAQVLASLNHPNIASIYGIEGNAIVMELVEGKDLAGPLPLDEALPIAKQIAEALEAAHEKGIIHRDLKPANIKITPQGVVKLLDFGLAKATEDPALSDPSNSPTLTIAGTQSGMIMGTAGYMSPEQASGRTVDRRADIWSFGVVLWEVLSGRKLFEGETLMHTLADVVRGEIDLKKLPAETPPVIAELIRRCLDRDVKKRLQAIGEARIAIDNYMLNPAPTQTVAASAPHRLIWPYAAFAAVVTLVAAGAIYWQRQAPAPDLRTAKFHISPPPGYRFTASNLISPDGRRLATVLLDLQSGVRQIWLRDIDSTKILPIAGTENARDPFWSPDSLSLGISAGGKLKRIDLNGGQVSSICDAPGGTRGAAWSSEGMILFSIFGQPIQRVPASGGTPTPALNRASDLNKLTQSYPTFLPDGRHFLFAVSGDPAKEGTYLASLDGKEAARRVLDAKEEIVFAADANLRTGYLFFRRQAALMAVRFDAKLGAVSGDPFVVLEYTSAFSTTGRAGVSASMPASVVVMRETTAVQGEPSELVELDRTGKKVARIDSGSFSAHAALSPDGKKLLSERTDPATLNADLWIFDLNRKVASRLAIGTGSQGPAVWSFDGRKIIFVGLVNGQGGLHAIPSDGSGRPELLLKSNVHHLDASSDGKYVVFEVGTGGRNEIDVFPLKGEGAQQPVMKGSSQAGYPQFSPDGRWLAYSSGDPTSNEIFVQSFPPGEGRWQVSNGGGTVSRWRRDGRELVYYDGNGRVWAVSMTPRGASLELGSPVKLFDARFQNEYFAMSADGKRFYANMEVQQSGSRLTDAPPLTIVFNWAAGLKR